MTRKKHTSQKKQPVSELQMMESMFHLEIRQIANKRKAITIAGVAKIVTYSEELMIFYCKKDITVSIKGKMLQCQTYVNRMILVAGDIQDISFVGEKNDTENI